MTKIALILLVSTGLSAATIPAYAHDENPGSRSPAYGWFGRHGFDGEINHLNRMVGHVRWQIRRYHADWSIRRDFAQIQHEVDRVNWRFRNDNRNHRELRREVDRLHNRLHDLEVRLRVRANDFYHWR